MNIVTEVMRVTYLGQAWLQDEGKMREREFISCTMSIETYNG